MSSIYYLFAIVYTFMVWGFFWGFVSFVLPIFPIIDLINHFLK